MAMVRPRMLNAVDLFILDKKCPAVHLLKINGSRPDEEQAIKPHKTAYFHLYRSYAHNLC